MRTVVVTGCNRGLGLEFARQLAGRGDRVIATAREPGKAAELNTLAAGSGGRIEVRPLEATSPASVEAFAASLKGVAVDLLINNAAVTGMDRSIADASFEEMSRILGVNVAGPLALTRALLPNLRLGTLRQVVMISSTLGSIAAASHGFSYGYCVSKAALNMLAVKLGKELAGDGFTVVTMCPGWNKTDMGGPDATMMPSQGVGGVLKVIDGLTAADNGRYINHEGRGLSW